MRQLHGVWLGRRRYAPVYALQELLLEARKADKLPDLVLFVEHEPVITLGRGAVRKHVLVPEGLLAAQGVDLLETSRGGDVTVHAPGQLVGYPILNLAPDRCDVRRYVRDLTETMRRLVQGFGIQAGPLDGYVGLWVDRENTDTWPSKAEGSEIAKIGAIGVRISRWVTMHGFALNLSTDLRIFRYIVPCGIHEHGVTSVQELTGGSPPVEHVARSALETLAEVMGAESLGFEKFAGLVPETFWTASPGVLPGDDQQISERCAL